MNFDVMTNNQQHTHTHWHARIDIPVFFHFIVRRPAESKKHTYEKPHIITAAD